MWKAGFFRLRGVLVGTVAFQAYAGPLGIRLSGRPLQTQDADFAQFWGISENIGESMLPVLDVLRKVDGSFQQVPNIDRGPGDKATDGVGQSMAYRLE